MNRLLGCKKITVWAILLLILAAPLAAQKGLSVEFMSHYGQLVKHKQILNFEVKTPASAAEISLQFQMYGRRNWHYWQNYPLFGVSLLYYNLGNDQTLGNAVGIFPSLSFNAIHTSRFDLKFQIGLGVAYISKYFNPVTNPTNNGIGSAFNNVTSLRLGGKWHFDARWAMLLGGSLTHFSNGASQLPNFGLNIPALYAGLQYTRQPLQKADYQVATESSKPKHRLGLLLHADIGFVEDKLPGGPKYPVYFGSIAAVYHHSKVNRLLVGFEYEQNEAIYAFQQHINPPGNEAVSRRKSIQKMVFVAEEWLFGNWGALLQAGTYFGENRKNATFFIYNKIGVRYYLPEISTPATRFFAGIYLKTHQVIAEDISIGCGATF